MYKKNDMITVIDASHRYFKKVGTVDEDQVSESWVAVTFESSVPRAPFEKATIHPIGLQRIMQAREYRKGDRVRINKVLGSDSQAEATVQGPNALDRNAVNVLVDGENKPIGYHFVALELIEAAPKPEDVPDNRTDGSNIRAERVVKGDIITVSTTMKDEDGFAQTNVVTGTVDKITYVDGTNDVEAIWATRGRVMYLRLSAGEATITLVKGTKDEIHEALKTFPVNSVIAWNYGKAKSRAVGLKVTASRWHIIGGTGPKSVATDMLRALLKQSGDSYEILEKG